jgi:hypothetical protein
MAELIIDANTRIQILDEVEHLGRARKHQYAAFIRSEQCMAVWADHVESVIPAAEALEDSLIQFIWRGEEENRKMNQALLLDEELALEREKAEREGSIYEADLDPEDIVIRKMKRQWRERPIILWAPVTDGLAIMTSFTLIALGLREFALLDSHIGTLVAEWALDGQVWRFALMIFAPLLIAISAFAVMCLIGSFVCYCNFQLNTSFRY